ncbi:hypothetical protein, partial [Aeromonas jandaei]|uniref:hypothetical protein n=1 Tax=Aeromonas jandaei TaxID=650 RepID=UPI0018DC20B2
KISSQTYRLIKNYYGSGYHEMLEPHNIEGAPHPGYGKPTAEKTADSNVDVMLEKMADMMQRTFGLKPKGTYAYRSPFPEWFHRVALPPRVKVPTDLSKFSSLDDTSTVEHISRYLLQLGEANTEDAFRVRYFPSSLTGPAFAWFTSLPPGSILSWADLEQKFHTHFYTGTK